MLGLSIETDIQQKFKDENFQAIGVDFYHGPYETKRTFQLLTNATYPICINGTYDLNQNYNVIPNNWAAVIDQKGIIRYLGDGEDIQRINDSIEEYLSVSFVADPEVAKNYALKQNYPNPFNPRTTINYELPKGSMVKIDVFNILGKKVITLIDAEQVAGNHQVVWDGNDTSGKASSNGVYFYRILTPEFTQIKKMILSK